MTQRERLLTLGQWLVVGPLIGLVCGAAAALFLTGLDLATQWRTGHDAIVFALPLAGLAIGLVYERIGGAAKGGHNLIIDTIVERGPTLPLRMAPLVMVGTILTHLFGGSAGREGAAVQIGASLSDTVARVLRIRGEARVQLVASGVAGGFAAVFGTPVAGTVFGLEFLMVGRLEHAALIPALLAAIVGDWTTRALGVTHAPYPRVPALAMSPLLLAKWLIFSLFIALAAATFTEATQWLKRIGEARFPRLPVRMTVGGALLVILWQALDTDAYLGLGVPVILQAFVDPHVPVYASLLKLLFTVITLGAGFLGGEVTALFFMGATLGNWLAGLLDLPLTLAAGVGLASLFAAAANTPLALSLMAVEILGADILPHVVIVSSVAWMLTGHRGLYLAQRVVRGKGGTALQRPVTLAALQQSQAATPTPDAPSSD